MSRLAKFGSLLREEEFPWDRRYVQRFKTEGGEWNMAGPPATYRAQAPPGTIVALTGFVIVIEGPLPFKYDGYASMDALTNGVRVNAVIGGVTIDLTVPPVKKLSQWVALTTGVHIDLPIWPTGPGGVATVHWESGPLGSVFLLNGDDNDALETIIQDDLSILTEVYGVLFGVFAPLRP